MTRRGPGLGVVIALAACGGSAPAVESEGQNALAPLRHDGDRDGIKDDVDACPDVPEDEDQFEPDDGCPERDNDGDGIVDDDDACKYDAGPGGEAKGCPVAEAHEPSTPSSGWYCAWIPKIQDTVCAPGAEECEGQRVVADESGYPANACVPVSTVWCYPLKGDADATMNCRLSEEQCKAQQARDDEAIEGKACISFDSVDDFVVF
jgi:hypothetical protein